MKKQLILFSILSFIILWVCIRNHKRNWDGIAYAALTISSNEMDMQTLHRKTYEMLRQNVPDAQYQFLTQSGIRHYWSLDAKSFTELLPIYKVKYFYVLLLRALWKLGIGPFQAMTLVSLFSTVCSCMLVFIWITDKWKHWTVAIVSFLICYTAGVYEVSRYWTPDAIAALSALSCLYMVIEKKSALGGILLSIITFWFRPDTILFLILITIYFALLSPKEFRVYKPGLMIGIIATLVASVFLIQSISGYQGVGHHLAVSRYIEDQSSTIGTFTLKDFLGIYRRNLSDGFRNCNAYFVFLILSTIGFFLPINSSPRVVMYRQLLAIGILALIGKVITFPILEIRFYVSIYCLICIALAANLWHVMSSSKASVIVEKPDL